MTLCNGRIKDGPTPVKAPHTRRRLTTLFLRPTLARAAFSHAVSPSWSPDPSLSLFRADARSPSPTTAVSPSIFISLRTSSLSSSPRFAPRQSDRSLALITPNTHPLSVSFPAVPLKAHFPVSLSCYLILPSRRAIFRVHPYLLLSSSLSLTNSLTLYKQSRVHTRWNVWGLEARARARKFYTRVTTTVDLFFFSPVHRTSHTRGGPSISSHTPLLPPLPYLSLSHARP